VETVSRELSISTATLERWRADALSRPARERAWTAPARFEAVLLTATMDEASKSAWCRERGVYPQELEQWRTAATRALADPEDSARTRHQEQKADRRRIKELERDLRRKEKALAEAAALLVLSKKLEAIFPKDKDEDA
jgi:transposase-like protein